MACILRYLAHDPVHYFIGRRSFLRVRSDVDMTEDWQADKFLMNQYPKWFEAQGNSMRKLIWWNPSRMQKWMLLNMFGGALLADYTKTKCQFRDLMKKDNSNSDIVFNIFAVPVFFTLNCLVGVVSGAVLSIVAPVFYPIYIRNTMVYNDINMDFRNTACKLCEYVRNKY